MKTILYVSLLFSMVFLSCDTTPRPPLIRRPPGRIAIEWIDALKGDYSFAQNWSYLPGVYKNQFGQLSCDGMCPQETDRMKDVSGKIIEDSLAAFYALIDTTHRSHSIQCDAWCYEWAGTDFATAEQ